jgi:long-chain acyl-CoA synthetase
MPLRATESVPIEPADSLAALFSKRVSSTPEAIAYRESDAASDQWRDRTWRDMALRVERVRAALRGEGLQAGDRVAIMLRNCCDWVAFDQAAYAEGLVVVPLYVDDRPDNIAYILNDAGCRVLLAGGEEHLRKLQAVRDPLASVQRIVCAKAGAATDPRVVALADWSRAQGPAVAPRVAAGDSLATIVYTSGTTGRPKGVMLSHQNILQNIRSALAVYDVYPDDVFLSFLPLSHMFERTVGYYLTTAAGATVAFARSIAQLAEDFRTVKPTVIVSVPRIFERLHAAILASLEGASPHRRRLFEWAHRTGWDVFEWRQGRGRWRAAFVAWPILKALVARKLLERMGGRLRLCVSGGAALNPTIARTFIGLGLPICQGYGLTEASPVVSANHLDRNDPASIGMPLPGVEVAFGENHVLLVKGPNVMLGYWNNPEATAQAIGESGWLHTGDQARIENGFLYITGRTKEIVVLGNGEKVPPVDMELAIQLDPLVEQAMIVGEGLPYLAALVVLDLEEWKKVAAARDLPPDPAGPGRERAEKFILARIGEQIREFPGYAQVRRVALLSQPWSVDNGLLTPTLKLKRNRIVEEFRDRIDELYKGHGR